MRRYPQAAGSPFSRRLDSHHAVSGSGGAARIRSLAVLRDYTQCVAKPPVALQDFFTVKQILNPHAVPFLRCRRILARDAFVGEQLQVVPRRGYADVEACRHLAAGRGTVLREKPNNGHPRQVPERVNDRLQMSCCLWVGVPGHTCNLAVPAYVLA